MILRKVRSVWIVFAFSLVTATLSLTPVVCAQDLSKTVLPITQSKWSPVGLETRFGTGFCLDRECRLIGTTYHVAMMARPRKIKGVEIIQRYLATGPDDEGATMNDRFSASPMQYNLSRDLAILELRHGLPHYHGLTFGLNDLQIGQQVDIYAYPKESINAIRSLVQFQGAFKGETAGGLLAFDYSFSAGKAIGPGASGGLVIDSKTQQVVGILRGVAMNGDAVAIAVPVQSLADFVNQAQPWLAQKIFPSTKANVSPVAADLYPKFLPPPAADFLRHRPDEPAEVKALREKAQRLADSMRNFVAVQTFAWGSGDQAPAAVAVYEVQVLDGFQRFREYPDGKKELKDVPFPPLNTSLVPGGEWSEVPQMVGTALRLEIHQAPEAVVKGQPIKVFQYRAESEDRVCTFKSVHDFELFERSKMFTVSCYGEVWTDRDMNILRISLHLELPGKWRDYQSIVTYGWLRRTNEDHPRLVPLAIATQAEFKKKTYWCHGLFTNYRIFSSRAKIVANDDLQSLPP